MMFILLEFLPSSWASILNSRITEELKKNNREDIMIIVGVVPKRLPIAF